MIGSCTGQCNRRKIMSRTEVYQQIEQRLDRELHESLSKRTIKRLTLMVTGMLNGQCSSPSKMAEALDELGLETAQAESIERRIRRSENDPAISQKSVYAPFVRALLARSQLKEIVLILDPTSQAEHVVMVSVNAWYRGRSLPLAWTILPGNVPLKGKGFWARIKALLQEVQDLLPEGVEVTILADRAFGSPAFTDLVATLGWHWLVRVVQHTHCRDRMGREQEVQDLVKKRGQRRKLFGQVFKKAGWRQASVVAYWGHRHPKPLLLATDLPPSWDWIALYRHRYPIEATFRDYKSYGWGWEQGQVRDLDHLERLLVVMALATCLTLLLGASFASQLLAVPPSGKRHTRPYFAKRSLFRLGLRCWRAYFYGNNSPPFLDALPDWNAPNWSTQYLNFQNHAFIFA
jgi:hypothetical protein